jgi:predicted RNA-binding protein with PIN domain
MPIIVDGDNLLGTWPGRGRSDSERHRLAAQLSRFAARERRRVVAVFDGSGPPGLSFGSDVHFSGAGRTADRLILEFLEREQDRRGWTVVTSDRSLGDRCRHLGARPERCDLFRRRLAREAEPEKPEREEELDYWLEQFGEKR